METNLLIISNEIVKWIKDYVETNRLNSLVVGVSGGVDSGLVSTLCAKTELPTYIVSLPIQQEQKQLERARNHCKWLTSNFKNVEAVEIDLTEVNNTFVNKFTDTKFKSKLGFANSRSRLRMVTLYQIAQSVNGIVVGTGNKIEDFGVGFYTKYGDGGVDISPIADLTKTEVKQMAAILDAPDYIVNAIPTDGLWEDDRTDENQIGASYEELEWAMNYENTFSLTKNIKFPKLSERQNEVLKIYKNFNTKNNHKMIPIPVFRK